MSSNGWKNHKLSELCSSVSVTHKFDKEKLIFLNTGDIERGKFLHGDYSDVDSMPGQARKTIKKNDILFSEIRPANGRYAFVDFDAEDYVVSTKLMVIRGNERILPRYLYLFLTSNPVVNWLQHLAESRSGTFPQITFDQVEELDILLPPKSQQKVIVEFISAIDDKIELNSQTNATLESIARGMFRSWFMDFDPVYAKADGRSPASFNPEIYKLFPSKFKNTELGDIPLGWEVMTVEDVSERVAMGPFGSSIKVETFVDEGIPIISGQHLRGFMLTDSTYNYVSLEHAEKLKKANVYRGDVIFTHAGNIENLAFIPEDSQYDRYIVSQRQFFMRCDLDKVSPSFITFYFQSPEGQHKLLANKSPVGVPSIAQPVSYLRSIKLPIPPKPILKDFERLTHPLLQKYQANLHESQTLVSLRNNLLPRLMNGEIEV